MNSRESGEKKAVTRADMILILILLAAGAGFLFLKHRSGSGSSVRVYVDNEMIAELPLNRDKTFPIANELGTNTIVIENGQAYMADADCPDKICEKMGKISKPGETIVCLPHKLIVEISDEY